MSMKYLTVDQLADHPKNVRAKTEYTEASIAGLAASIKALGLLQSLVVQQIEGGGWGVLAGRRRMLALRLLAKEGALEAGFKLPCKVIGKDVDHVTALSLAENTMQEPMAPIDEFEAFAAMIEEGSTVPQIAESFGTTVRAVKERLRYGLVHADIRAAVRAGTITLDAMKAYAGHPCQETQKRVFDGLVEQPHEHQSWRVRNVLADQDIRADDPLALMVMDRYRERGGEMVEGLFEEDTVLKDRTLAEAIRDEFLMEKAEAVREAFGFKWAETRARLDYAELSAYGRVYEQAVDLDEAGEARLAEIAARLDAISEEIEAGRDTLDEDAFDALNEEYARLEEEADRLQNAYLPEQAARAGVVVAHDGRGGFRIETGLVRAEDYAAWQAETAGVDEEGEEAEHEDGDEVRPAPIPAGAAPRGGEGRGTGASTSDGKTEVDPLSADALSGALRGDLAVERALAVAAAVSEDLALAYDLTVYRLAAGFLGRIGGYSLTGLSISAQEASRDHSRPEALDQSLVARIEESRGRLDLSFLDAALDDGEKFRRFRDLEAGMKDRLLAAAIAMTIEPIRSDSAGRDRFSDVLAAEALPDIRSVWRPTAANYWSRVSRDHMLALLKAFGLVAEAEEQRNVKKATLAAYMESLFAQPFATLTEEQRIAVETWTPPGMGTRGEMVFETVTADPDPESDAGSNPGADAAAADGETACSSLEPGERVVGRNAKGEMLIEDEHGVRSVETGGVYVTEPVPVIPGAGFIPPDVEKRRDEFLTAEESAERKQAA